MTLSLKGLSIFIPLALLLNLYLAYKVLYDRHESAVDRSSKQDCENFPDAVNRSSKEDVRDWNALDEIRNDTLGFQNIFVINLPRRTDRRDAMVIAAKFTDLNLSWIDGLAGSEVADITVPLRKGVEIPGEGSKGSWRAHLNAIREVVEKGLGSALVMEDDLDWDVRLKDQMEHLGQAVRTLTQPLESFAYADPSYPNPDASPHRTEIKWDDDIRTVPPKLSPYGDDWDVLWLGHCGMGVPDSRPQTQHHSKGVVVNTHDETVPVREKLYPEASYSFLPIEYPSHTRIYHHTYSPTCTFAYAVSQRGARKILYELAVNEYTDPYDNMLRELCDGERGKERKLVCLTTQPALFPHWRPRGSEKKDSDIGWTGEGWRDKGESRDVRWSVMANMEKWVRGEEGNWFDQYPD